MRLNLVRDINVVPNQAMSAQSGAHLVSDWDRRPALLVLSHVTAAQSSDGLMHACTRAVALYMYMSPGSARLGGRSGGGMSGRVALVGDGAARGE